MKKSRNEPCHCGSGKKYKKCCLEEDEKKHLLEHKINTGGFFFDGERLVIPQESMKIFGFLAEIILEIENILSFEKRLKEIGGLMAEYMDCISDCWKKLKENNIDFEYHNFSENPKDIAKKLHFKRSPRSEAIIIFSYIETLRCLWTAYDKKTSDEKDLRDASDSAMDYFLKEFCLCSENKWVKDNPEMSGKFGHRFSY